MVFQPPLEQNVHNLSDFEKERLEKWCFNYGNITEDDLKIIQKLYPVDIDLDYLCQVYDGVKVIKIDGVRYLTDYRSQYVNIISGERITYDQPEKFANSIYIFGQCTARGNGVEDKHTIASFMQKEINREFPDTYRINNCGIGCGSDLHDELVHLKEKTLKKGDIVIFLHDLQMISEDLFAEYHVEKWDCSFLFDRPHDYGEWFTDETFHTLPGANEVISDYICRILKEKGIIGRTIEDKDRKRPVVYLQEIQVPCGKAELEDYLKKLRRYRHENMRCGCIVMTCNPFTEGHLYLVETAAKTVDWLYLFITKEGKFFFRFEDRLELVKKGTAHLKNVSVFSTSTVFATPVTFPGYFNRDQNPNAEIDASLDINLFCKYIAPELGIKIRFLGEEPMDYVTRQYNTKIKEILPMYGIEVCEIKRKELLGKVISASEVRKLLKEGRLEEIRQMVPPSTYNLIKEKYRGI